MKVSGENCGIVAKELADGGRIGVEIGEGGRRGGWGRGRSRVRKHSVGGFMYDMAAGRIHTEMMGSKEVITEDRIGHLAQDKRQGKFAGGKG